MYFYERGKVMIANNKRTVAVFFILLFAATMVFLSLQDPAWAKDREKNGQESLTAKKIELLRKAAPADVKADAAETEGTEETEEAEEGSGVHADPATFEKNFLLSPEQKAWTIRECERVVSEILNPDMSDLEKYYTLAVWVNQHVEYDWEFWKGRYHFEYYSHQWDAYGAMKGKGTEKSVCVGIAIFYSNMCHAAGLPCRFVRTIPTNLDHTINYIPDINGNAYYVDVTENMFLMSDKSNPFLPVDKEFSKITKDATDYSFDYINKEGSNTPSPLKNQKGNYKTYDEWFREFALHENTKKKFAASYEEKGSGLTAGDPKSHHASYHDYPSNFSENPDVWFLEDFYTAPTTKGSAKDYSDPSIIRSRILNKEFDDQLINVSGLKTNYDCSAAELAEQVKKDISVSYFPSSSDGVTIVPEAADLTEGKDYTVTSGPGDTANTAKLTITAAGDYKGQCELQVKINSALVTKPPVPVEGLSYDGTLKQLVEPGEAECGAKAGEMRYALGSKTKAPEDAAFSKEIPTEANAGTYYIWYKAAGDASHAGTEPQRMALAATIEPMKVDIILRDLTVKAGETAVIRPELELDLPARFTFISADPKVVSVTEDGVVKGLKAGRTMVFVDADLKYSSSNYAASDYNLVNVKVLKGNNPMTLTANTVEIKAKDLRNSGQTISQAQAFTVENAKGTLSYKFVSARKGTKSFNSMFSVNAKTGRIAVQKGLKKGTYKVKVKVRAKGNKSYKPSSWKKVTCKVVVK